MLSITGLSDASQGQGSVGNAEVSGRAIPCKVPSVASRGKFKASQCSGLCWTSDDMRTRFV